VNRTVEAGNFALNPLTAAFRFAMRSLYQTISPQTN
jgi:hypothetical protein